MISLSLPTRECGLKYLRRAVHQYDTLSLPTRECGLKSEYFGKTPTLKSVTPYAGVWIEIKLTSIVFPVKSGVTPYAGVWIEISKVDNKPMSGSVTPYAGVWIEIIILAAYRCCTESLPTRECGLKSRM